MGFYLNGCACGEKTEHLRNYEGDVALTHALGFDGVKIDSCGAQKNMTLYASLFNETGKPIVIENCHQGQNFTDGGDPGQMGPGWCPCAPSPLACALPPDDGQLAGRPWLRMLPAIRSEMSSTGRGLGAQVQLLPHVGRHHQRLGPGHREPHVRGQVPLAGPRAPRRLAPRRTRSGAPDLLPAFRPAAHDARPAPRSPRVLGLSRYAGGGADGGGGRDGRRRVGARIRLPLRGV